jgi:hypothetical protein
LCLLNRDNQRIRNLLIPKPIRRQRRAPSHRSFVNNTFEFLTHFDAAFQDTLCGKFLEKMCGWNL